MRNIYFTEISSPVKTTLLFVIRDYVEITPKEQLSAVILDEMMKIWNNLEKPASYDGKTANDMFDFSFAFLPHKVYKNEAFLDAVKILRAGYLSKFK